MFVLLTCWQNLKCILFFNVTSCVLYLVPLFVICTNLKFLFSNFNNLNNFMNYMFKLWFSCFSLIRNTHKPNLFKAYDLKKINSVRAVGSNKTNIIPFFINIFTWGSTKPTSFVQICKRTCFVINQVSIEVLTTEILVSLETDSQTAVV